ncbi:hypothetical protein Hanom_Chr11g01010021 [Helianthus anomalus]
MGYDVGLGCGLERNAQVITSGGLGFGRGHLGGSLRPGVEHAIDPMWPALIGLLLGHNGSCLKIFFYFNTPDQATPG